jgi:hypothetical protein
VHEQPHMKPIFGSILLILFLAACRDNDAVVRGDLAPGGAAESLVAAWVVGREGREPITGGQFELRSVPSGVADLRLGTDDGEAARLLIRDLPGGATLTLHGIRVQRRGGLAFPARIELRGGPVVTINGIRMAPQERLPGRIREDATVLARSDDAGALLVRPADARLPDLRVVVTDATETVTPDGDPAPLERIEPGDSVYVEGATERGYVIAARLVLPRRSTLRSGAVERDASGGEPAPVPAVSGRAAPPPSAAPAGQSRTPSAGEAVTRPPPAARRGPPGDRPGRGRGRDRGRGPD